MDIIETCAAIVDEHEQKIAAEVIQKGKREVRETIAYLEAAGRLPLAAYDREWLVSFILERPDRRWKLPACDPFLMEAVMQHIVTLQEVEQWIHESLVDLSISLLPQAPPLPSLAEGDCWEAVEIEGGLYCCGCRSLYEGKPRTLGDLSTLREGQSPYCRECGIDL